MQPLPQHVAIIMDGNGRWAKKRGLPRSMGHRAGVNALFPIVEHCAEIGIPVLTLYAFSTENWTRPKEEVSALMSLLLEFCLSSVERLRKGGVRVKILGDLNGLPEPQRKAAVSAMEKTAACSVMLLNIAINYGGRAEITMAAQSLAQDVLDHKITPQQITPELISGRLYTAGQPDVDLVIRTSGEMRISNFLLYQSAYAEFYAAPELWPDFDPDALDRALQAFAGRNRRFGGLEEKKG